MSPCPISGLVVSGKNDELVSNESLLNLKKRLTIQKSIEVKFDVINAANHFFKNKEKELVDSMNRYIKDKVTIV